MEIFKNFRLNLPSKKFGRWGDGELGSWGVEN
jgi:hypothetical protein